MERKIGIVAFAIIIFAAKGVFGFGILEENVDSATSATNGLKGSMRHSTETVLSGLHNSRILKARSQVSPEEGKGSKDCPEEPKQWELFFVSDVGFFDQGRLDVVNRGFQTQTNAQSAGFEYLIDDCNSIGMAYSILDSETHFEEGLGNIDTDGHLGSFYITHSKKGHYFDVLYMFGDFEIDTVRNTLVVGDAFGGGTGADSHTLSLNMGKNFEFCGLQTGPIFAYDYTEGKIDGYTEMGEGSQNITFPTLGYRSSITSLGWHASKSQCVRLGCLTIQGSASWDHEFEPDGANVQGALEVGGFLENGSFSRPSAAPGTDWLNLGTGVSLKTNGGVEFRVDYQAHLLRDDVSAHYLGAKVSAKF